MALLSDEPPLLRAEPRIPSSPNSLRFVIVVLGVLLVLIAIVVVILLLIVVVIVADLLWARTTKNTD